MPATLNGRHVLFLLSAFFGVVFAVNGTFVYVALKSFSGLTSPHAYEEGLHYNRALAEARTQAALGWTGSATVTADRRVVLAFRDRDGRPLDGLTLAGRLSRPASAAEDREIAVLPAGNGAYRLALPLPAAGNWLLVLTAGDAEGHRYAGTYRLWVRP